MDRRRQDRRLDDHGTEANAAEGGKRKKQRRRQIDPTTCERDYTDEEIRFMHALDEYKRRSGRMFPTCSEILEVVRAMGYVRLNETCEAVESANETSDDEVSHSA
ncbi:MAG: hypothetical protein ACTHOU_15910 [Aureliella sp.]